MNDSSIRIIEDKVGDVLCGLLEQAQDSVTLIAPFIKQGTVARLLAHVKHSAAVTLVTRWKVEEIAAGVSDTSILDLTEGRQGFRVFLNDRLHAKTYVVDDTLSVVGSANLTDAALNYSNPSNIEILALIEPAPTAILVFVHRLVKLSTLATADIREAFDSAVKSFSVPQSIPPMPHLVSHSEPQLSPPFPVIRNPERLFEGYMHVCSFQLKGEREALLDDLGVLSIPDGLNEEQFRKEVGRRLLMIPEIAQFDEFVTKPRRFGELTDWIKQQAPYVFVDHKAAQRYMQTLIRWLLFFLPYRYRLAEPHYSEIFGRFDSWE